MDIGVHRLAKQLGIQSHDLVDLPLPPPIQMLLEEGSIKEPDAQTISVGESSPPTGSIETQTKTEETTGGPK